jgi:hypothetical protein
MHGGIEEEVTSSPLPQQRKGYQRRRWREVVVQDACGALSNPCSECRWSWFGVLRFTLRLTGRNRCTTEVRLAPMPTFNPSAGSSKVKCVLQTYCVEKVGLNFGKAAVVVIGWLELVGL